MEFIPCLILPVAAIIGIGLMVLWVWMLVDCAMNEPSDGNDKIVWILIVVLLSWLGALLYFFIRRPERIRRYGQ